MLCTTKRLVRLSFLGIWILCCPGPKRCCSKTKVLLFSGGNKSLWNPTKTQAKPTKTNLIKLYNFSFFSFVATPKKRSLFLGVFPVTGSCFSSSGPGSDWRFSTGGHGSAEGFGRCNVQRLVVSRLTVLLSRLFFFAKDYCLEGG